MERAQKKSRAPKKELLGLYRQCRLLVEAIANRVPDDREMHSGITGRFAFLINEGVYERENQQRVMEIGEEQTSLLAELSALRFTDLGAFCLLNENSIQHGLQPIVDYEDEKSLVVEGRLLHVPLRSLAALETILKVYEESDELILWKKSIGCSMDILQQRIGFGGDIPVESRGIVHIHLAEDFEKLGSLPDDWKSGPVKHVDLHYNIFRELEIEIAKVVEAIHTLSGKALSGKSAAVAGQTLKLVDGLPLEKLEQIVRGVKEAAELLLDEDGIKVIGSADELLKSNKIAGN